MELGGSLDAYDIVLVDLKVHVENVLAFHMEVRIAFGNEGDVKIIKGIPFLYFII